MKGTTTPGRHRAMLAMAAGFGASSMLVFAAGSTFGEAVLGSARGTYGVRIALAIVLLTLLAADLRIGPLRTPAWRRQTPRSYWDRFGPTTASLLWGVDAGALFTTYRMTSLTWGGLALAISGLSPWWAGGVYALGFLLPTAVIVAVLPWRRNHAEEPGWLMELSARLWPAMRYTAAATLLLATGIVLAA